MTYSRDHERRLAAARCRDSFWHFCNYALGYERPGWTWWTPRVHKPFCDWFQHHVEEWEQWRALSHADPGLHPPRQKYLMVCVHREFGKTMIITKAGLLWLHLRNPDISTYIGSSTVTRAGLFFGPLKEVLQGNDPESRFTWLYGNWYDPKRTWTTSEFVHGARINQARTEPSVGTWGVETGLVGMHPDVGFMDDPIDYEKMASDGQWLEKVNSHITGLSPVFRADSLFVYTGTRYHDADFIGESLRLEGAKTITGMPIPSLYSTEDGKWHVYFRAARDDKGEPTFPENWPDDRLRRYERQNPVQYAAQLLNDPNTGAHVVLNDKHIEYLWVDTKDVPSNLRITVHIDTAFKSRESVARGDDSVIIIAGHARDGSGEVYYLEGYGSDRWRASDFNTTLVQILQRLRRQRKWPSALTDEAEIGGKTGTWELTIQNWCHEAGIPSPRILLLSRSGKKKISRITEAADYWVTGKVRLVRGAPGVDKLINQMLRIGTSAHDDWSDAFADAFHKEVYFGSRSGLSDPQPEIIRPYDDRLLTGTLEAALSWKENQPTKDPYGNYVDW